MRSAVPAWVGTSLLVLTLGLGGCASLFPPPQTAELVAQMRSAGRSAGPPAGRPLRTELVDVPFFAPTDAAQARHCGPLALASALAAIGRPADPAVLASASYLPARGGSLTTEMLAAGRRYGAYTLRGPQTLSGLFDELDAGRPVVVLQNLGLGGPGAWYGPWFARWHYAVLVGHDRQTRELILRSGDEPAQRLPWETFEHTWARAGHWSALLLKPGELPLDQDVVALEQAALDVDRVAAPADALAVWLALAASSTDAALRPVVALGASNRLVDAGRLDEAAALLQRALAASPGAALANNLAHVEARRGRPAEARAALARAVEQAQVAAATGEPRWLTVVRESAAELGLLDLLPPP
ncbi:PA2778 family cysteine peptidase [Sphaerotilus mobilis]|uniref:Tetratricopeptide repeat protein n=1 Tax=Sphaerotilus mobilis TaxID=47994 RepID=A0A4Q7LV09_9BURK|nr:PA2778 family cysteine peptidase [Sphaerotilus mobilis]RZS58107.1 tetratricopeptide repeat protein [Sphaerotilus mobilis]